MGCAIKVVHGMSKTTLKDADYSAKLKTHLEWQHGKYAVTVKEATLPLVATNLGVSWFLDGPTFLVLDVGGRKCMTPPVAHNMALFKMKIKCQRGKRAVTVKEAALPRMTQLVAS